MAKKKNKKVIRYRRPLNINVGMIIFAIIFLYLISYVSKPGILFPQAQILFHSSFLFSSQHKPAACQRMAGASSRNAHSGWTQAYPKALM